MTLLFLMFSCDKFSNKFEKIALCCSWSLVLEIPCIANFMFCFKSSMYRYFWASSSTNSWFWRFTTMFYFEKSELLNYSRLYYASKYFQFTSSKAFFIKSILTIMLSIYKFLSSNCDFSTLYLPSFSIVLPRLFSRASSFSLIIILSVSLLLESSNF